MAEEPNSSLWITPQRNARCFERHDNLLFCSNSSLPKGTTIVVYSMRTLIYDHKYKMCVSFKKEDFGRVWVLVEELVLTVSEIQKLEALWDKTCREGKHSISPIESVFFAQLQLGSGVTLQ